MTNQIFSDLKEKTQEILAEGGVISQKLASYEYRAEQLKMACGICESIEAGRHLIVEAGTGIGKSLAYLIPFIIYAAENDVKVVISTFTKTLQNQLYLKDLPFLKDALGIKFSYALCLGSENYLCQRRLNSEHAYDLFDSGAGLSELKRIAAWSARTESGIKSDLDFVPSDAIWGQVSRDAELCLGKKCSYKKGCFYKKAKERERMSHILITNHSLFFTNLASGGRVLPGFQAVVFDEAQTLEDVATSYLGFEISNAKMKYLFDSLFNTKTRKGLLAKFMEKLIPKAEHIEEYLEDLRRASDKFFEEIGAIFGRESTTKRIRTKNIVFNYLEEPLKRLANLIDEISDSIKDEDDKILVKVLHKRCVALISDIKFILNQKDESYVYWIEVSKKTRGTRYSLFAAPIEIADELENRLFSKIKPIVLTSATLAADSNFYFLRSRLGIKDALELLLGSPFNYEENVLLYLPKNIADPNEKSEMFQIEVSEYIKKIIDITKGRTFVLFTSYEMLNRVYDDLVLSSSGLNLMKQGDRPRYLLLENFKKNENSVLLGTSTFWQGVDVPGRPLECVIITRLPFSVPDDPVTEARMELIESRGENPFITYQVPQAAMMFKQGFGRLIRTKSDRGVVAVLDPRIRTRYYGRSFLNVLPKCRHTFDIDEVKNFFSSYLGD